MALGRTPDADDPPHETRGCDAGSRSVSSATFFWDSDSPSHSWILGRVSLNSISQCTIDPLVGRSQSSRPDRIALQQAFNPPPACFAVSLLPSLASGICIQNNPHTPLFEVRSAKVGPRHFVLHQHVSRGPGASSLRVSPFRPECQMQCHCHPGTRERLVFQVSCPQPTSPDSGTLLVFAERVLVAFLAR